jgi:hypothetical protein
MKVETVHAGCPLDRTGRLISAVLFLASAGLALGHAITLLP